MNRFAALLDRLAYEPGRNAKLRLLTDYFRSNNLKPNWVVGSYDLETIYGFVAAGMGSALLPRLATLCLGPEAEVVELSCGLPPRVGCGLVAAVACGLGDLADEADVAGTGDLAPGGEEVTAGELAPAGEEVVPGLVAAPVVVVAPVVVLEPETPTPTAAPGLTP